ncbi:MAG: WD40 repeat domain-containing protein, partial [Nocardioidaceae bacterium]|nr:WD40 repeat domain-containing protein [Nocardioidaceae bacterium]
PSEEGTPAPTPTETVPAPNPTAVDGVRKVKLSGDTEAHSGEPDIPYVFQGSIVKPDGSTVAVDRPLSQAGAFGSGWVGRTSPDDQGDTDLVFLDAGGKVTDEQPVQGDLAFSDDGSLVAYATTDGRLMVAWDGPGSPAQLRTQGTGTLDPVAVLGSQRCDNPEGQGGCIVYYNQQSANGDLVAMTSSRHGTVDRVGDLVNVEDVSPAGVAVGMVSATDTGSCSAALSPEGRQLWKTCDYSLGRISPNGDLVVGRPAYRDGIGDGLVAILDMGTGKPLVEFDPPGDAFVNESAWDVNNTLLTMLYDDGWALMREDQDGAVSSVSTGRMPGAAEEVPVHFGGV